MKPVEIEVKISVLRRELAFWEGALREKQKGCTFCMNFAAGECKKFNAAPPEEVATKTGCDEWEWDEIPF